MKLAYFDRFVEEEKDYYKSISKFDNIVVKNEELLEISSIMKIIDDINNIIDEYNNDKIDTVQKLVDNCHMLDYYINQLEPNKEIFNVSTDHEYGVVIEIIKHIRSHYYRDKIDGVIERERGSK